MISPSGKEQHGLAPVAEQLRTYPQHIPHRSHEKPALRLGWAFYPAQVALLAAVYFGAAKLGLTMAFVAEQVTAVWPPTGIALAALFFLGYRAWPGVALGAFLVNATVNEPLGTAAGIALGNTLGTLAGAWMLRRLVGFDKSMERVQDVVGLMVLGAGLSTMVSATIGATSLCLGGVKPWMAYPAIWSVWWLGDAMGNLVVAPLLFTWAGWHRFTWRPRRVTEAGTLLLALAAVSLLVFVGPTAHFSFHPLAYTVFPLVIWAALRFGQPAATLMTFVASSVAIWGTVHGSGPFAAPTMHESLILLQIFMSVVAVTTLVLAAVTIERERAKEAARQSRDELRQSHNLLRAVIEGTTDAVFVKDRQGRYVMINTAGARFLGKTAAEVIGKDDTEVFSFDTARTIMEGDRRIMATGEIQTYEDVGTAAGVTRTYLSTKGPYRDAQGNIIGLIGISCDITERKRAEVLSHARAQEFRLAREIQQGLLPQVPPTLAGFEIGGASHPTQETGGDYFDFIPMSDGYLGVCVGDASGHGIAAALFISTTCAYVRALALTHLDPGTILGLLNTRLAEDTSSGHFVTLFFARLCARTRSLVYSNAGHWPGYVFDAHGEVKLVLQSTSLPLGVDPSAKFSNGSALTLDPGDLVFMFSDGIVEAHSGAGSLFGVGRALEVVRAHRHEPPDEIIAALLDQVCKWSESAQQDDMTAIVIKVGG